VRECREAIEKLHDMERSTTLFGGLSSYRADRSVSPAACAEHRFSQSRPKSESSLPCLVVSQASFHSPRNAWRTASFVAATRIRMDFSSVGGSLWDPTY